MKNKKLSAFIIMVFCLAILAIHSTVLANDDVHVDIPGGLGDKSCYECHVAEDTKVERSVKYSIREAFETYLQSPHGRYRTLGDKRAPTCSDCHGSGEWSQYLPVTSPKSPIHPDNLAKTCANCHGKVMLETKVSEGSMHLNLASRSLKPGDPIKVRYGILPGLTKKESAYYIGPFDITAYVNWFFTLLTIGTLSIATLFVIFDFRKRLALRLKDKEDKKP